MPYEQRIISLKWNGVNVKIVKEYTLSTPDDIKQGHPCRSLVAEHTQVPPLVLEQVHLVLNEPSAKVLCAHIFFDKIIKESIFIIK